jgi:predicted nucleotidyltransferase component of viral defense system
LRYSEDIDLVQVRQERIGPTIDAVREALSWLGDLGRNQAGHSIHMTFRFAPEVAPDTQLNLKIEINTREHSPLEGLKPYPFHLASSWHEARSEIVSFSQEELFGTKLRALLQRRKGRDLFDLHVGLKDLGLDAGRVVASLNHYLGLEGNPISRAEAEKRMLEKLNHSLTEDIDPLLPAGVRFSGDDAVDAFGRVWHALIVRLDGDPWKQTEKVVAQLQEKKYPNLLK